MTRTDLQRLAGPVPAKYLESRRISGRDETYMSHGQVTMWLLAMVGAFSLDVVEVRGLAPSFTSKEKGTVYPAVESAIVGAKVTLTVMVDGREVRVTGSGSVENAAMVENDGERLKLAESDGLKRAARLLGAGLQLWVDDFWLPASLEKQAQAAGGSVAPDGAGRTFPTIPDDPF